MADPFIEARQLLPNMPEEIFSLWFDGRIKANGWPPTTSTWAGALRKHPISFWQTLQWEQQEVGLQFEKFTAPAQHIISGLIAANFCSKVNMYSLTMPGSKMRTTKILQYIGEHKAVPGTLILLQEGDLFEVVDGSHRLAVFFYLLSHPAHKNMLDETQLVWLASPQNTDS